MDSDRKAHGRVSVQHTADDVTGPRAVSSQAIDTRTIHTQAIDTQMIHTQAIHTQTIHRIRAGKSGISYEILGRGILRRCFPSIRLMLLFIIACVVIYLMLR